MQQQSTFLTGRVEFEELLPTQLCAGLLGPLVSYEGALKIKPTGTFGLRDLKKLHAPEDV